MFQGRRTLDSKHIQRRIEWRVWPFYDQRMTRQSNWALRLRPIDYERNTTLLGIPPHMFNVDGRLSAWCVKPLAAHSVVPLLDVSPIFLCGTWITQAVTREHCFGDWWLDILARFIRKFTKRAFQLENKSCSGASRRVSKSVQNLRFCACHIITAIRSCCLDTAA